MILIEGDISEMLQLRRRTRREIVRFITLEDN